MLPGIPPSGNPGGTPPPSPPPSRRQLGAGGVQHSSGAVPKRRQTDRVTGGRSSPPKASVSGSGLPEGCHIPQGQISPSAPLTTGRSQLNGGNSGSESSSSSGSDHLDLRHRSFRENPRGRSEHGFSGDPWGLQHPASPMPAGGRSERQRPDGVQGADGLVDRDDWNPESWLGRAALNTAAVVALPVVVGMRLADKLPWTFKAALCFGLLKTAFGLNRGFPVKDEKSPVVQIFKVDKGENATTGIACTGTMLTPTLVVTAAHCVLNANPYEVLEGTPCNDTEASGSGSGDGVGSYDRFSVDDEGDDDGGYINGSEEYDFADYGDSCLGQYNTTYYNPEVAEPNQFFVLTGITNETLVYEDVIEVIPRSGFNFSDPRTLGSDIALLRLNGTGFANKNLNYPRLQTKEEHRKMRHELNKRDKVWRQNTRHFKQFEAEWKEYEANNKTGQAPTIAPNQFNDPNMKAVGWGDYKPGWLLKKEASGKPIGIDDLGRLESTSYLRKGKVGVRGHRDQKTDPMAPETQKMCDKDLLCQEAIRTDKGLTSGLCSGDSGGPLFFKPRGARKNKQEILVGVASRGGCGFGGQWVDIHRHENWIKKHMNHNDHGEGTSGTQQAKPTPPASSAQQPAPSQQGQPAGATSAPTQNPRLRGRTALLRQGGKATQKTKHLDNNND